MSDIPIRGLTTIVIPCWNEVEFTQQCIAALKSYTRPRWELIVIDNGSTDATGPYLAGVRDMAPVPVTVVTNVTNLGFPAAINQGLRLARGEYLVMLNNDVVVTDGWLDQLIALANAKRRPTTTGSKEGGEEAEGASVIGGAEASTPRSGDRKTGSAEAGPAPFGDLGVYTAEIAAPQSDGPVMGCAETSAPGPPFARGESVHWTEVSMWWRREGRVR